MTAEASSFRYFILGLLTFQPMSGYDIRRFSKKLGWLMGSPSFGVIYPTLHALLQDGLVTVKVLSRHDKPPRKIYSVTEAGGQLLREWVNRPDQPVTSVKAFIMRLIMANNSTRARLVVYLKQWREQVADQHTALEPLVDELDEGSNLGRFLALDYSLAVADAELAWLDGALDRLSKETPAEVIVELDHTADAG